MAILKCEVNTVWFHDDYLETHPRLHNHKDRSKDIYLSIIKAFFEFIKGELYKGEKFSTIIGTFFISRVDINPNKARQSHAANNIAREGFVKLNRDKVVYRALGKDHYYTLMFSIPDNLRGYRFKVAQKFSRKIHLYYE